MTDNAWPDRGDERRAETAGAPVVLIVDDEPAITHAIAKLLARRGFTTIVADSGAAAIARLRAGPVDGMIVDFHIPDMRGDVLYATAIALQPTLKQHVVFVTGDVTDAVCDALAWTKCVIIFKPFEIGELEQTIQRVITDGRRDGRSRDGAADSMP